MIKNYLIIAFRSLRKNLFYTAINIIGLSVGLATCLLIMMYVTDELSYDRYNQHADRIFRVNNDVRFGGNHFDLAVAPSLMGPTMAQELPQVEQYTRLQNYGSFLVKKGNSNLRENKIGFADSNFFQVFTLPLISGDAKTALKERRTLVITERTAMKYFSNTDVVGKVLVINDSINYKITAVMRNMPEQSHFQYDFLVPTAENDNSRDDNWLSENWNTYVLLKPGSDVKKVEAQTNELLLRHTEPLLKSAINQDINTFKKNGGSISASLMPVTAIHLHSNKDGELQANSSSQYVYVFSAVAVFILLIACVNFMNLSTARSANRAKEVGVRKVLGSLRNNLIAQFLIESMLISLIALVVAYMLALLLLPYFNTLAGKSIPAAALFGSSMIITSVSLIILVGLLAGSYPAFFLSGFQPIDVLKGKLAKGFKGSWVRNSLVVFQFIISIVLIVGTLVIYKQLTYIRSKDIGFNRDQVLVIKNADALGNRAKAFKEDLLKISGVTQSTMTGFLPVNGYRNNDAFFTSPALDQKSAISMQRWSVDANYIPTLGMKIIEGRNFSPEFLSDSNAIIINEAAARFLNSKDLLNKRLYELDDVKTKNLVESHIIGVVKNFNFNTLRDVVIPLALKLEAPGGNIALRVQAKDINNVVGQIRNNWQAMAPAQPFEYVFMDEEFNALYSTEQKTGKLVITFAVLAILIASLGLFGLVTFAAEQRTREIGIRKVLGASVSYIAQMLSKEFLKLVLIAAVVAIPLAWWMMHHWLQDFAYRTTMSWWIFALASLLAAMIALFTVGFQAIKAALQNPVQSLRSE